MVYVHKAGPGVADRLGHGDRWTPRRSTCRSSGPGSNLGNYHNADFDGMVDQAQTHDGREAAARASTTGSTSCGSTTLPAVPLYQQIDLYGASKRLNWKARSDELIKAYDMSLK